MKITRNAYNVMRKIASMQKLAADLPMRTVYSAQRPGYSATFREGGTTYQNGRQVPNGTQVTGATEGLKRMKSFEQSVDDEIEAAWDRIYKSAPPSARAATRTTTPPSTPTPAPTRTPTRSPNMGNRAPIIPSAGDDALEWSF